ncbi:hypothetical protein I0C86_32830 [Plantactinospora sp. S1510]|uniref:FxLD family lantipeptide n=1 Tax=Plantactinospora alkalitolerans TaxID=2789879 RepID=A0ABS0H5C5_9ACTN|nr:hypothetical protein [Plantactinospora alkalitolerans]MBF9133685.1 hypothetical protein [Plantactinospora alkalitolerans]
MSRPELDLDLDGLEVDTISILSADSLMAEGHGTVETGASCATSCTSCAYCSCYTTGTSCFAPESPGDEDARGVA